MTSLTRTGHDRTGGRAPRRGHFGHSVAGIVEAMPTRTLRRSIDVLGRPVDAVARRLARAPGVVILVYHRVGGRTPSPVDLSTAVFVEQLDRLAERAAVVDLDQALRVLERPSDSDDVAVDDLEPPRVVLTFDDGTADWLDVVAPELVGRGLPATFFVATDHVDRARPFPDDGRPVSWSALADLASTGVASIGSHTHHHRVLRDVDAATATDEIERSVDLIEARLGTRCRHFAYPKAIAPSPAAETVVRRRFESAALAGNRVNRIGRSDVHRLGRHPLTRDDDIEAFERKVAGGAVLEGTLRSIRDGW